MISLAPPRRDEEQLLKKKKKRHQLRAPPALDNLGLENIGKLIRKKLPRKPKMFELTGKSMLYVMRHGVSEANEFGMDLVDPMLSSRGATQASLMKMFASDVSIDLVITSPLRRCVQTACLTFQDTEVPIMCSALARDMGDPLKQNTVKSEAATRRMLRELPRGDAVSHVQEAIQDMYKTRHKTKEELAYELKVMIAARPEKNICVITHMDTIMNLVDIYIGSCSVIECKRKKFQNLEPVHIINAVEPTTKKIGRYAVGAHQANNKQKS